MFWWRFFSERSNIYRPYLTDKRFAVNYVTSRNNSGFLSTLNRNNGLCLKLNNEPYRHSLRIKPLQSYCSLQWKYFSKGLNDGDVKQFQKNNQETDLQRLTELFPQPRVTLNEYTAKTPKKIFDIHFKQNVSAPKGVRKKVVQNDWTCTYAFTWPEIIKFEGTAISKRQAAEKAAVQALNYLHQNKRINPKGSPIYDQDKIQELRVAIQQPLKITISENSIERIDRIWKDYEDGIKDIYNVTCKQAEHRIIQSPPVFKNDSTIDKDDEFSESDLTSNEDVGDMSEIKMPVHPVYGRVIMPPSEATLQKRDRLLEQRFRRYDEEKTPLPIDQYADEITSTLSKNRVVVIVGAAGCGKSTRVPAAVLRGSRTAAAVVSEPRRVAAIGLAERVANELGEQVGDTIGYQVRLQARPPRPPAGSILYCTSGLLLRRLHSNPGLEGCTHVFIDEAHERDVNTDVTLLLLKRALDINPQLKIVVMSATLDVGVFTRYFNACPVIEVPGRTYPVEISYLNDIEKSFNIRLPNTTKNCQEERGGKPQINCQEIVQVIKSVDRTQPAGAILVFLPGWAEIKQTKQLLDADCQESTHLILPVHSRLSTTDQVKMFAQPLPGVRKIVLATNIAETSVTIPDVVYVIDSGAHKENRIREGTGTASLETVWVSLAGAKQRAGRAGRVQKGHCYRLYTTDKEADFAPHTTPEILRIPLEETVLDCKTYAPEGKIEDFLSQLPEPPSHKAIHFAVNDLIELGALTPSEQLTRVGSILSRIRLPPRLARTLLHAGVAGSVLAAGNVVTHTAHNLEMFANAADRRDEIREIKRKYNPTSDHAALHWIQEEFERSLEERDRRGVDEWCDRFGLRRDRLHFIKSLSSLHLEQLFKTGVLEPTIDPEELNRFSDIDEMTAAILLSGSNSLLKTRRHVRTKGKLSTVVELFSSTGDRAHIGSESVNHNITKRTHNALITYFGGYHSTERRALVVYKTSIIPPHTALLFCMGDVRKNVMNNNNEDTTILSLPKHNLHVHLPTRQAESMLKAREMLWNTFQYYIVRDVRNLDYEENTRLSRFKIRLMKAIGRVLVEAHREYVEENNVDVER